MRALKSGLRNLLMLLTPERCGWLVLISLAYTSGVLSGQGINDALNAHLRDKLNTEERHISALELDCRSRKDIKTVDATSVTGFKDPGESHP